MLDRRERLKAIVIFVLMLASAAVEVLGVASVMPFVAVLGTPEIVTSNRVLSSIYSWTGLENERSFLVLLGGAVLVIFLFGLLLRALTTYALLRYSFVRAHRFSYSLLSTYLSMPFEFFSGRNTADLSRIIFSEVNEVTNGVLLPLLKLLSSALVVVGMFLLLLFVDPAVTATVSATLGGSFLLIYVLSRRALAKLGAERLSANSRRFVVANEALGGVKELKLMGREHGYLERFRKASLRFARMQSTAKTMGDVPHFAIQGIAFGGILILVLYLTSRYQTLDEAIPLIALYAFAGYRLLPALQEIFKNGTQIRFYQSALDNLHADLKPTRGSSRMAKENHSAPPQGDIAMASISYAYPSAQGSVVSELSLTIPRGKCVAFVGSTGAGKSTAVDLMMGLLTPQSGTLSIGGVAITEQNLRAWQQNIGYVPQSIYLADASVTENIAFGVPQGSIDQEAVERAAKSAHVHEFVAELVDGYDTKVGERGTRLSGGQRQRIGIARALYHDPDVLVFDEATSALDNATEAAVMEAVDRLAGHKTIILIAHRLTTVRRCDTIFLLSGGRLVGTGTYDELQASNEEFARMAAGAS
ncbi:MAG: ATP-binding cassette domain-containing protein [Dehalococcoidia bacterium]